MVVLLICLKAYFNLHLQNFILRIYSRNTKFIFAMVKIKGKQATTAKMFDCCAIRSNSQVLRSRYPRRGKRLPAGASRTVEQHKENSTNRQSTSGSPASSWSCLHQKTNRWLRHENSSIQGSIQTIPVHAIRLQRALVNDRVNIDLQEFEKEMRMRSFSGIRFARRRKRSGHQSA